MFYLYILHNKIYDKYYVGYSNDFHRRHIEHNTSERNTFTSKFRPWDLVAAFEAGVDEGEVLKIEKFIKKQKSRSLIEKMIRGDELQGILSQLVRVPYLRD